MERDVAMDNIKKNIKRVFCLYLLLFLSTIIYLSKFIIVDSESVITNSYNRRMRTLDETIIRGDILSSNGEVLAYSEYANDTFVRKYPFSNTFSHVVGYSDKVNTGIESKYNFKLQRLNNEVFQRISNSLNDTSLSGSSLELTIDDKLQKLIYDEFPTKKGAVIVTEPKTGKILSMVSFPNFNPNNISENWNLLNNDTENAQLLNRATQALYSPGSTFKMITAIAALENIPNINEIEYECKGVDYFDGNRVRCFGSTRHGKVNLKKAMQVSCNTYFAYIGKDIADEIREVAERVYFNSYLPYDMDLSISSITLNNELSVAEKVETSFGQGNTLVTPLHMAIITGAVANGGYIYKPYVVDKIITPTGKVKHKNMPIMLKEVFDFETTSALTEMMIGVVEGGTANAIKIDGISIAAKTGTAENETGVDHGWLVAFVPANDPQVCITILLESADGGKKAFPLAKKIIKYVISD